MEPVLIMKLAEVNSKYEEYLPSSILGPYIKRYTFIDGFKAFSGIRIYPISTSYPELVFHYAGSSSNINEVDKGGKLSTFSNGYVVGTHKLKNPNCLVLQSEIHSMNVILSAQAIPAFLGIPYQEMPMYRTNLTNILGDTCKILTDNICNAPSNLERIKILEELYLNVMIS